MPRSPSARSSYDGLCFLLVEQSRTRECGERCCNVFRHPGLRGPGWAVLHVVPAGATVPRWSPQLQYGEDLWWPGLALSACDRQGWLDLSLVAQDHQNEHLRTTCHGVQVLPQPLVASCLLMSHGPKQMARPSLAGWEGPALGHGHREAGAPGGNLTFSEPSHSSHVLWLSGHLHVLCPLPAMAVFLFIDRTVSLPLDLRPYVLCVIS